jgi:hypothetical protein
MAKRIQLEDSISRQDAGSTDSLKLFFQKLPNSQVVSFLAFINQTQGNRWSWHLAGLLTFE